MPICAPSFVMPYPWLRKRVRDLWVAYYRLTRGQFFVAKRFGMRLLVDCSNVADKYLLAFGNYEEQERIALFSAAKEAAKLPGQKLFLDVGAHSGYYALWAYQTGIFDRIVAVEADPRNAAQLRANLFLNDLTQSVEVVDAAASDTRGELEFLLAQTKSRTVSRVGSLGEMRGAQKRKVRALPLDDLDSLSGGVLVAKIDVEGFESNVLRGALRLLSENKIVLQVEVFPDALAAFEKQIAHLGLRRFGEVGNDRFYRNF